MRLPVDIQLVQFEGVGMMTRCLSLVFVVLLALAVVGSCGCWGAMR